MLAFSLELCWLVWYIRLLFACFSVGQDGLQPHLPELCAHTNPVRTRQGQLTKLFVPSLKHALLLYHDSNYSQFSSKVFLSFPTYGQNLLTECVWWVVMWGKAVLCGVGEGCVVWCGGEGCVPVDGTVLCWEWSGVVLVREDRLFCCWWRWCVCVCVAAGGDGVNIHHALWKLRWWWCGGEEGVEDRLFSC